MRDPQPTRRSGLVGLGLLGVLAILLVVLALALALAPWLATEHARIVVQRAAAAALLVPAALSCVWARRTANTGALVANMAVLAVGAVALYALPRWSGLVVAGAYAILVVWPIALFAVARRRAQMRRHDAAIFYGRLAYFFHPSRRLRAWVAYQQAELQGMVDAKVSALRAWLQVATSDEIAVIGVSLPEAEAEDDWERVLSCARADTAWNLKASEIRSLGELGRLDEMLQIFAAAGGAVAGLNLTMCRLYVLAFTGRQEAVGSLLAHELRGMAPDRKAYWGAIALRYSPAGAEAGRRALAAFAETTTDETARRAALRHLSGRKADAPLSAASLAAIEAIKQHALSFRRRKGPEYPVTKILMGLVLLGGVLAYLHGAAGGSRSPVEIGALTAPLVLQDHQWWRLMTAPFLHDGWIHTVLALYLLVVIGVRCERSMMSWQMALVYAVGALVSEMTALVAMASGGEATPFAGASGPVFAAAGGLVAVGLLTWLRAAEWSWKSIGVRRAGIAVGVAIFLCGDMAYEVHALGISYAVHLASLFAGFAVTLALLWRDGSAIYVRGGHGPYR
jgi:rhomboid protease GluP